MTRAGQVFASFGRATPWVPRGRPGVYPPALQDVGEAILTKPGWPKEAPAGCLLRIRAGTWGPSTNCRKI
jgi:hypothetical protein